MERIVFVDTETTGFDQHQGYRVIEIAFIEHRDDKETGRPFNTRLYPDGKTSEDEALAIHNIQDAELVDEPTFKDLLESM